MNRTNRYLTDAMDLAQLSEKMRAVSPREVRSSQDPTEALHAIEQRSLRVTLHRRWGAASAALAVAGVVVGLLWPFTRENTAPRGILVTSTQSPPDSLVRLSNATSQSTVFDLGLTVGRVLARPQARFSYDQATKKLLLDRGTIVAHIFPGNSGFRIVSPLVEVEVRGTLFSVNAETGDVRVWHGSVETRAPRDHTGPSKLMGDEDYHDISGTDLDWLGYRLNTDTGALKKGGGGISLHPQRGAPGVDASAVSSREEIDAERQLVLQAQAELAAGRPADARAMLSDHRSRFPQSVFREEVCLLMIQAVAALKDLEAVSIEGTKFLKDFPNSARVGDVLDLMQQVKQAPDDVTR